MVIDLHPRRIRYIDSQPENVHFWPEWIDLLKEKGWELRTYPAAQCPPTNGPWVACVNSLTGSWSGRHAVVMIGDRLFHDPSNVKPRKRDPRRFFEGYVLVPV